MSEKYKTDRNEYCFFGKRNLSRTCFGSLQYTQVTKPLSQKPIQSFAPTRVKIINFNEGAKAVIYKGGKMPPNNGHELQTRVCDAQTHSRGRGERDTGEIKICDLTGRTIKKHSLNVKSTSLIFKENELSPGLYYFTAWINNKLVATKKFVIIK